MSQPALSRKGRGAVAFAALALVAAAAGLLIGDPAGAVAGTASLGTDQQLNPGERLVSPDGRYVLAMQGDGNLVEYAPGNRAVWATGTGRANSVVRMQGDGNLVVIAPGNVAVWSTGTSGNPGADVELQNDGNVVLYGQGHVARWASASGGSGGSGLGGHIADLARAEAGNGARNHEIGGYNCNFYTTATGGGSTCRNGWRTEEWCADFARWVWGQAGASTAGLSAAAASFYTYGSNHHTWRDGGTATNAHVGDAVVYRLAKGDPARRIPPYASHVGLVVGVDGSSITVVSGNSGPSDTTVYQETVVPAGSVSGYASPVA